jgi:hypothetical protein
MILELVDALRHGFYLLGSVVAIESSEVDRVEALLPNLGVVVLVGML